MDNRRVVYSPRGLVFMDSVRHRWLRDPYLPVLAEEIELGKCVIFVGAGVSAAAGLPSWSSLVDTMRGRINSSKEYGHLRTADICRHVLGNRAFGELVATELSRIREPSPLHRRVARLPGNLFITTNFDQLLETALRTERQRDVRVLSLHDQRPWRYIPDVPSEPWLLKPHGCIGLGREQLILSEEDFLGYASDYEHVERGLSELLVRHPALFIGYSMRDPDVLNICRQLHQDMRGDVPNRYFVDYQMDAAESKYLEHRYGFKTIDISPDATEDTSHENPKTSTLLQFLDAIVEQFQIPAWIRTNAGRLGGIIDGHPGLLDERISSIFPPHDVTALSRFLMAVQRHVGQPLPVRQIIGNDVRIRDFLHVIREATSGD